MRASTIFPTLWSASHGAADGSGGCGLEFADALIAGSDDIPVHVVGEAAGRRPKLEARTPGGRFDPRPYLAATLFVGLALLVGLGLQKVLVVSSISLVFLTAVLTTAAAFGLGPSLYACFIIDRRPGRRYGTPESESRCPAAAGA